MGGLFAPEESSSHDDEVVSDDGQAATKQDLPEPGTSPNTNTVADDDENPF